MPTPQPIDPLHSDLVRYFEERDSLALESDDVLALKSSNDYVGIFWAHGLGYVRSVRRARMERGFRVPEAVRYIPIRTEFDHGPQGFCAYVQHTDTGNEARAWHTIAGSLRIGDLLVARWFAGNSTSVLRENGMDLDECWLEVWPQGNQTRRKVYLLGVWVGSASNPTRMCRRGENQ